jgi:dTDP-4-dehydrorhamnose 3,5-epimerase
MKFTATAISGVIIVEPAPFSDIRGVFMETWHREKFRAAGIPADFVQDNQSRSVRGVLRGLHYQMRQPQGKLVRVIGGAIADVAVDLRRSSPTFGRHVIVKLDAELHRQLWIPPGFAHGFCALSDVAEVIYKCTDFYDPGDEHTIRWDDPDLAIRWPLPPGHAPVISDKDGAGATFRSAPHFE